jgi:hypothetical protein
MGKLVLAAAQEDERTSKSRKTLLAVVKTIEAGPSPVKI